MTTYEFLGPEWLLEVEKLIKKRITPETIRYATTSVLTIFEKCPDSTTKALLLQTYKGELAKLARVEKPYPECEFTVTGDYAAYIKIFEGKLDPMASLMGGELHFQGNMLRAMGMISLFEPFFRVLSEIPTDFQ